MFRKIISQKYFCGFDLGTQTVKAALIKDHAQQSPELLGVYESKTAGFKSGSLTDMSELAECIHLTIAGLLGKTGVKLKDIQLGIGGELISKHYSNAVIPLLERGSKVISYVVVLKFKDQSKLLRASTERRSSDNAWR